MIIHRKVNDAYSSKTSIKKVTEGERNIPTLLVVNVCCLVKNTEPNGEKEEQQEQQEQQLK